MIERLRTFLRDFRILAAPYWSSEERWPARGLLLVVVGLSLGQVYLMVLLNTWYQQFYDALQNLDREAFGRLILRFAALAAFFIASAVYGLYLRQMLEIRWRRWLTDRWIGDWLSDRAYYRMRLVETGTDNPDQRIAEDLRLFVAASLELSLDLLSSLVTLGSFIGILWTVSGSLAIPGTSLELPAYMVWAALLYALVGSWITHARRAASRPPQLPAAALRGRLPLRAGAAARDGRGRGALSRRGGRGASAFGTLLPRAAQLVGDHAPAQEARDPDGGLCAGGDAVPVHRRGAEILRETDPARRLDADLECVRSRPGFAVLVHLCLRGSRRVEGHGRPLDPLPARAGRHAGDGGRGCRDRDPDARRRGSRAARPHAGASRWNDTAAGCRREARARGAGPDHRAVRQRQEHLVPRSRRDLAVRRRVHRATLRRHLSVPAAKAVHPHRNPAERRHVPVPRRPLPRRGAAAHAASVSPRASGRSPRRVRSTGSSVSRRASSSGSRSRVRSCTGPRGSSSTRRAPRSTARWRISSTRCWNGSSPRRPG